MIWRKALAQKEGQQSDMKMLIVILAGGEGSRMGGGKPLRLLRSETLISRAIRRAFGWSGEVRLALREAGQAGAVPVPILLDDPGIWGPLAGLSSGLKAARELGFTHVLTLPCDMPFLPADMAERLSAAAGEEVAIAGSGGQLHPVCGLWPVSALDHVAAYVASGRRSLKGLAAIVGMTVVDWPERDFVNVNDPGELEAAERRLASEVENADEASRL